MVEELANGDAEMQQQVLNELQKKKAERDAILTGEAIDSALSYICEITGAFVREALTPTPNISETLSGIQFGGGRDDTKHNTQAINLHVLPNKGARWSTDGGLEAWLDVAAQPQWNLLRVVDFAAECAQNVQNSLLGRGIIKERKPVLITLDDSQCNNGAMVSGGYAAPGDNPAAGGFCVSAAAFIEMYREYKVYNNSIEIANHQQMYNPPNVDGFLVQVDRTRGCNATGLAKEVTAQAETFRADFGGLPHIWFSVGVDAYDTRRSGEYPTVLEKRKAPNQDSLQLGLHGDDDARTQCLMTLIGSINTGCDNGDPSLKCGIVVQEYADSHWRAVGGTAPIEIGDTEAVRQCDDTVAGSPERAVAAAQMQLPCGDYKPCAASDPNCAHAAGVHEMEFFLARRLPQRLICDPRKSQNTPMENLASNALQPCGYAGDNDKYMTVDPWHNVAYDGLLMAPVDDTAGWYCNERYHEVGGTLLPRRAYYTLKENWGPTTSDTCTISGVAAIMNATIVNVTLPSEWHIGITWRYKAMKNNGDFNVAVLFIWLTAAALVIACGRGCLSGCGTVITASFSVLIFVFFVIFINMLDIHDLVPLPYTVTATLNELGGVLLLVLIWCPINGGGGRGHWWWVHFAMAGWFLTAWAGVPDYEALTYIVMFVDYVLNLATALTGSGSSQPQVVTKVPPWDPCRSDQCCVRHGVGVGEASQLMNSFYFPWAQNVTVPDWWDPYLPWYEVIELLVFSMLLAIAFTILIFVVMQLLFEPFLVCFGARRWKQKLITAEQVGGAGARGAAAANAAQVKLRTADGVYAHIDEAQVKLAEKYGDHFQTTALDAAVAHLKGFVESRARRMQGYSVRVSTNFLSEDPKAMLQKLSHAVEALNLPESMPQHEATALWMQLTSNLRSWLLQVDFRMTPVRKISNKLELFKPIRAMLKKYGPNLSKRLSTLAQTAQVSGPGAEHWEFLLLYLLMGQDNFFRVSPEVINLLFSVYYCSGYKHTLGAQQPKRSDAPDPFNLGFKDLSNLRSALYELQRYSGGKLGNRTPDMMGEKFMNYDDLGELCTADGGAGLFDGLEALVDKLYRETLDLVKKTKDLTDVLADTGSDICSLTDFIIRSADAYERLSRLPNGGNGATGGIGARNAVFATPGATPGASLAPSRTPSGKNAFFGMSERRREDGRALIEDDGAYEVEMGDFGRASGGARGGDASADASGMPEERLLYNYRGERVMANASPTASRADRLDALAAATLEDAAGSIHGQNEDRLWTASTPMASMSGAHNPRRASMETNINVMAPRVDRLAQAAQQLDGLRDGLRMLLDELDRVGLTNISSTASTLRSSSEVELARAKLLQKHLNEIIKRARKEHPLPRETRSMLQFELQSLAEQLDTFQRQQTGVLDVVELSALNQKCRAQVSELLGEWEPAYVASVTSPERFTWGHDNHKTYEERPGYMHLLLTSWFLWEMVALLLLAMCIYTSGGYIAWALMAVAPNSGPLHSFALAIDHMLYHQGFAALGVVTEFLKVNCQGYAPMWFAGYLTLAIFKTLLSVGEEVLWLCRAVTTDSQREHQIWAKIASIQAKATNNSCTARSVSGWRTSSARPTRPTRPSTTSARRPSGGGGSTTGSAATSA